MNEFLFIRIDCKYIVDWIGVKTKNSFTHTLLNISMFLSKVFSAKHKNFEIILNLRLISQRERQIFFVNLLKPLNLFLMTCFQCSQCFHRFWSQFHCNWIKHFFTLNIRFWQSIRWERRLWLTKTIILCHFNSSTLFWLKRYYL